ncbi:MAG: hypothetical protein U0838_08875 [Chloroflexota bacterium]
MAALTVGPGVIRETVRLAALEVPGVLKVGRGGPRWRGWIGGSPVRIRVRDGQVHVTLWIVARPRQRLVPLTSRRCAPPLPPPSSACSGWSWAA